MPEIQPGHVIHSPRWPEPVEVKLVEENEWFKAGRLVHNQTTLPQVLNLREGKPYNMQDVYSCLCG